MTDKEKRELKDGVISIFKRFNILDHTATIGGLKDGILRYISSLQEEPVSEELEEAVDEYAPDFSNSIASKAAVDAVRDAFKAGAKWQMAQVIKNAVEGGCFFYKNGYYHISCDVDEHLTDIKMGDKVKVIVVKED